MFLSFISGHFSCFHILAIENNAAVNTGVHVSFQISIFIIFSDKYTEVECLGHIVVLFLGLFFFFFPETSTLFSIVTVPIYISAYKSALFSTSSPTFTFFFF